MIIIKKYRLIKDNYDVYHVKSRESGACPICDGTLKVIGTRRRQIIAADGEKRIYIIRRLRCAERCGKIHHELPDIMVPYKRHSAETLEKISENDTAELYVESNTITKIREFISRIKTLYRNALPGLKEKYRDMNFSEFPLLKELVRTLVNGNLWVHTRSAYGQT